MERLDITKVPLKIALGVTTPPDHFDLLYDIVSYIDDNDNYKAPNITLKVISTTHKLKYNDIESLLSRLTDEGYLKYDGKRYTVITHPWF